MRRFFASLGLALTLTLTTALGAGPLHIDGQTVDAAATVRNNTTYVSLRAVVETLRPDAAVFWSDGQAAAEDSGLSLTARPGNLYLEVNGRALYIPQGVLLENGRTLVPVRVLADALGAAVDWNSTTGAVTVTSGGGAPTADEVYDPDAVLWLSRTQPGGPRRIPRHHLRRDL
ncbi:copper amine oxidase N-terminal domain-containing protein [uncultured Intestinimonas sp.]|uniref:copper amine oxidase N-terminal domain-containing protein n=1 Tax=uncultured Intestinimonas sp. TaxID=1689265 RepID=UPI0025FE8547|nr:copper amine oxidase N-terminal domain-containing protein [uncultured Intestinimonas sp.]